MSAGDNLSHELALTQISPRATGPDKDRVGLSHFAWQMDSFEDLKQLYKDMGEKGVKIGGIEDHGISIGVYFFDPEGNEIEAYYELPSENWPSDGDLFEGKFPHSLEGESAVSSS
jgi:catechol-2,3-dioxygenase